MFKKIEIESKFHKYCNGGCITYVEFNESINDNYESLLDLINYSLEKNLIYLGFNFPLDICNQCDEKGTFDKCNHCGSANIYRLRRVSGYLEILENFTEGKKHEAISRVSHN